MILGSGVPPTAKECVHPECPIRTRLVYPTAGKDQQVPREGAVGWRSGTSHGGSTVASSLRPAGILANSLRSGSCPLSVNREMEAEGGPGKLARGSWAEAPGHLQLLLV